MSTQGPSAVNQPNQASDDELAAIYLRDRDVPCPSCAYNRRGGHSSTCPECGSALTLIGIDAAKVSNFTKLARSVLLYLWVLALLTTIYKLYYTINMAIAFINIPRPRVYYSWLISSSISFIFWLIIFFIALRRWRGARKNETITTKGVVSPIRAILVFVILMFVYDSLRIFF